MAGNPNRPRVLIVDDSLSNIELLDNILGKYYETSFATNGAEALELIGRCPPNLVLLDVVMPGIDGYEVCRCLKANIVSREIPVIFLTSLDSPVDEEYGLSLGAADFIHKPISSPVVSARVRSHLALADSTRELRRHNEGLELLIAERTEELIKRNRQLIAAQGSIISAFCALAEVRDNETGNHIRRTQHYVRELAEALQTHPRFRDCLDDESIEYMYKTAPLHDIGKVAIPDAILLKPGKLTEDEWVTMKRHCEAGKNAIVSAAKEFGENEGAFLGYAADIAYCHHERWDGSGYPRGLRGDDIPVSARLMAVADVYDALTTRRVYKPAFSHEESVALMMKGRGSHFDPDMVDAMQSIVARFQAIANRYRDDAV
jgi:putative two-component system response regulator